jgi:hypothetical protein
VLKEAKGVRSVVWRPLAEILKEEGIQVRGGDTIVKAACQQRKGYLEGRGCKQARANVPG